MRTLNLWIHRVRDVKMPQRANATDSWIDLFIPNNIKELKEASNCVFTPKEAISEEEQKILKEEKFNLETWEITIPAGYGILIPSWLKMVLLKKEFWRITEVWEKDWITFDIVAHNKSWVATKKNLIVWAQVIDEPYRGEVHIHLINASKFDTKVQVWDKITQVIIRQLNTSYTLELTEDEYKEYENTSRWAGGFGSTGTK